MELAYVTNLHGVSGASVNADRVCSYLATETDVDVTAVHSQSTGLPKPVETVTGDYPQRWAPDLLDGLVDLDPDIVFVHSYNPDLLLELRGQAEVDDRTWLWRHGASVAEQWLTLGHYRDADRVTSLVTDLSWFDGVFCPSKAAAMRLNLMYGADTPPMTVAPIVIEPEAYDPTPFLAGGTLRIVTASRVAANNYLLAPLLAARNLATEHDVEMRILSAGKEHYREVVDRIAGDMEFVEIEGNLPPDDVIEHLEWSDVVCIPSYAHQSISTVAAEAMAAGNVVLAGQYQAVNEEESIIRVPVEHGPAWYAALQDVVDDPEDAQEWVDDGIAHAADYAVERVVEKAYLPQFHGLTATT